MCSAIFLCSCPRRLAPRKRRGAPCATLGRYTDEAHLECLYEGRMRYVRTAWCVGRPCPFRERRQRKGGCEFEPGKLELRCFQAHVDQSCRSKVVASGVTVIYAEITFLHWPFPRSVRTSQGASNDPDSFPGELADFRYQPQFFTHTKESNPLPWLYWVLSSRR